MEAEPGTFDLLRASLMVACIDEDVDVDTYIDQVDRMTREIQQQLPAEANDTVKLEALNKYLFAENGFHGSRFDYDHRANSYLSRVIDDREGLPITLSVLYIEMAERLGLQVVGIGLPGHFVVRWDRDADSQQLIDVFDAGKFITREDAARIVKDVTGQNLQDEHLAAPSHEDIIVRMVRNLIGAAERQNDKETMLRYYHLVVMLRPESVPDRGLRAVLRSETGRRAAAIRDLDWILEKQPPGIDLERIRQMRQFFEERKN